MLYDRAVRKYCCTSESPGELLKVSMSRQDQLYHSLGKSLSNQYYFKSSQVTPQADKLREPKIRYIQGSVRVWKSMEGTGRVRKGFVGEMSFENQMRSR